MPYTVMLLDAHLVKRLRCYTQGLAIPRLTDI
jgi:hypothetical protein